MLFSTQSPRGNFRQVLILTLVFSAALPAGRAQDRLKSMPGYDRYQKLTKELGSAYKSGALSVTWKDNGAAFEYQRDGKRFHYDIASGVAFEVINAPGRGSATNTLNQTATEAVRRSSRPARGRQFASATSPDGKLKAFYRDGNIWMSDAKGTNEWAVTTDGNLAKRVKYGSASWVYGEELNQTTAMWWATNSQRLAFYRFDESAVRDYYLALDQTNIQDRLNVEPYPKAGATNPVADLFVYDAQCKATVQVDVRSGQACSDSALGHYVYGVSWTPDGAELLFHRTDRRQKIMELCAADPSSGKCRVILREEWPATWVDNSPEMRFLNDGNRFIWASERTGWKNYYLYSLQGQLLRPLTEHHFEVAGIVRVVEKDSENSRLFYLARSADNPLRLQLHRVALDGSRDRRLTSPAFHHSVDVAPDGRHFVDVAQTHGQPPVTRLCDAEGKPLTELATSDTSGLKKLGTRPAELFAFKAADGTTDLYGMLHFPSSFKSWKKYPLLVSVYAGPATTGASEQFALPNTLTELGFLVASFDSRSASGRGKKNLDAIYQHLGQIEIDDQAEGVKFLSRRRYVDARRVGIFGTSYGGTASLLCLLRHTNVFRAACASSPVTDFRNYDSIYTERYLGLPQENPAVYDQVSSIFYAPNLSGRLMLYYGTADDNVHPSNALQLIKALQKNGKSFEVQVGPDAGHTALNRDRMLEFFIDALASPSR